MQKPKFRKINYIGQDHTVHTPIGIRKKMPSKGSQQKKKETNITNYGLPLSLYLMIFSSVTAGYPSWL